MPDLEYWEFICRAADEIPPGVPRTFFPPGAHESVDAILVERLGGTVAELYPEFAAAFPAAVASMQRNYGRPLLVLTTVKLRWIHRFLSEGAEDNLLFGPKGAQEDKSGSEFDRHHAMLPSAWRELYRWFDSFSISEMSIDGRTHFNTPLGYSGRQHINDIRDVYGELLEIKISKRAASAFKSRLDSDNLRCWMCTEAGDTLWLDEQRMDQKVYHAPAQNFADVVELPDPSGTLDHYLAHFIGGGAVADFDFRGS